MSSNVLIVSAMQGAENCARSIAENLGVEVQVAGSRARGLAALKETSYDVVVLEESLIESDPEWADEAWAASGYAMQLQVNFAISGCARLGRQIRAALLRRDGELASARRAVALELESELRSSVTGLLLESELALREPSVSPGLEPKLRHLVELAAALRERLEHTPDAESRTSHAARRASPPAA